MAVTFGAIGTTGSTTATTSVTAAYPSGISADTSKLYLIVTGRSNTANTAADITGGGWTKVGEFEGGTGTWGVDSGTRRVEVWRKDTVTGTESGNVTVTLAGNTNNTLYARILRVEVTSGYGISEQFVSGADTTAGTGVSATASDPATFGTDDLVLIAHAGTTDTATLASQAITASGVTFGTRTNRATIACTGGNDHRHVIETVPVTTGSGTPAAPTYAYTASANTSGPVGFVVLTEVAPPVITVQPTDQTVTEPSSATFSASVTGATSYQWQAMVPDSGGGASPAEYISQQRINPGTSATPGAQSVDVATPAASGANVVVAVWSAYMDEASETLASLTSNFADFSGTLTQEPSSWIAPYYVNVGVAWAKITDSSAGRTITPVWDHVIDGGPVLSLVFLKVDDPDDFKIDAKAMRPGGSGTAATLTLDTSDGGLAIALDSGSGAAVPNPTGWTSLDNGTVNASDYRLRMIETDGSPLVVTSTTNQFSGLSAISVAGGGSGPSWVDIPGATSSSYNTGATDVSMSGTVFRLYAAGPGGSVYSNEVTLTVNAGGNTKTSSADVALAILAIKSATVGASAVVVEGRDVTASVAAAVRAAKSAQAGVTAAVQDVRAALTAVDLAVSATHADSVEVAAAIAEVRSAAAAVALAIDGGSTAAVGVDVLLQGARAAAASVALQVQAGNMISASVATAVQALRNASASLAAAVQTSGTASADVSLAILAPRNASADVSLQVQAGNMLLASVATAVQALRNASASLAAAVTQARSAAIGLALVVRLDSAALVAADLAVLQARNASVGVSLSVYDPDAHITYDNALWARGRPRVWAARGTGRNWRVS